MARKFDRYGRNRQFRRNPTRSRKFFPHQLPFIHDFRVLSPERTEVSAETASRWRQVVADITNPNKRKRDDDDDGYYERMQYTQSQANDIQAGISNVRRIQRRGMEIALNGIPVGRSLAALDNALAAGIKRSMAQHARNNQLQFYNYWI